MESKLEIKKRLHNLVLNKKTDCASNLYRNPVEQYIDPKRFSREKKFYLRTIQFALGPHLSFLILEIGIQLILLIIPYY